MNAKNFWLGSALATLPLLCGTAQSAAPVWLAIDEQRAPWDGRISNLLCAFGAGKLQSWGRAADTISGTRRPSPNSSASSAREMLADILLESSQAQVALAEYRQALALSPNRFNGLYGAGKAAEAIGDTALACEYYATLLKITDGGARTARAEIEHARSFSAAASL